jgi:hypothetical protein
MEVPLSFIVDTTVVSVDHSLRFQVQQGYTFALMEVQCAIVASLRCY